MAVDPHSVDLYQTCGLSNFACNLRGVGLMAWGWVEYSQTEETPCVGTGDINPRTLALASRQPLHLLTTTFLPLSKAVCCFHRSLHWHSLESMLLVSYIGHTSMLAGLFDLWVHWSSRSANSCFDEGLLRRCAPQLQVRRCFELGKALFAKNGRADVGHGGTNIKSNQIETNVFPYFCKLQAKSEVRSTSMCFQSGKSVEQHLAASLHRFAILK